MHELGELVAKRRETPAELIRGLILRELKRDKEGLRPSVEMIEITARRVQIVNLLMPLLTGMKTTPEMLLLPVIGEDLSRIGCSGGCRLGRCP